MKHLHVSPFLIGKNGRNMIHMMCRSSGYEDMLSLVMLPNYTFYRPKKARAFDIAAALDL